MTKHNITYSKIVTNNDEHRSIKEYFATTTAQSIPRRIKEKISIACTDFVVLDNRLFQLICSDRFVNLAETIFSVGRSMSNSSNVNMSFEAVIEELSSDIVPIIHKVLPLREYFAKSLSS
ncbi:unnamed protein product [Rotaria sp. Silwood2]|nr:unnamed protein product [Rotaria sp. Silwood2]CAF4403531.1 unnamed protein product [Rotaria sp. Silwood2]